MRVQGSNGGGSLGSFHHRRSRPLVPRGLSESHQGVFDVRQSKLQHHAHLAACDDWEAGWHGSNVEPNLMPTNENAIKSQHAHERISVSGASPPHHRRSHAPGWTMEDHAAPHSSVIIPHARRWALLFLSPWPATLPLLARLFTHHSNRNACERSRNPSMVQRTFHWSPRVNRAPPVTEPLCCLSRWPMLVAAVRNGPQPRIRHPTALDGRARSRRGAAV